MCISRRLFGDLAEWTWGSLASFRRRFGVLTEWSWGSRLYRGAFRYGKAPSSLAVGVVRRLVPQNVSQLKPGSCSSGEWFPKGSHSCSVTRLP